MRGSIRWAREVIGVVVEGDTDVAIVTRLLAEVDVVPNPRRIVVCDGKASLDARLPKYRQAALRSPWFVLRDSDRDQGDCAAALLAHLLPEGPTAGLCLRLAVREAEAWLLGDAQALAAFAGVPVARIPPSPDDELDPKRVLAGLCRHSRRRHVRDGVPPRAGSGRAVGPAYRAFIEEYCESWRPAVAAESSPSLHRALSAVTAMVADGRWTTSE